MEQVSFREADAAAHKVSLAQREQVVAAFFEEVRGVGDNVVA